MWEIEASPQTKILGILTSGYKKPTVVTKIQTTGYLVKLPYSYETENVNFKTLLTTLNQWFGINKVDAFRGSYTIPSLINISTLDPSHAELTVKGTLPQKPDINFTFNLVSTDFKKKQWTLSGASEKNEKSYINNGKICLSKDGKILYELTSNEIKISDLSEKNTSTAPLPANFPVFSWAVDIACDTKRNIVTVVSFGGEGFLYRFDAAKKKWIDFRSLNNTDLLSLAYDSSADRYVGWSWNGELIFISANGDGLFSRAVADQLSGFGRLYDKGNNTTPRVTLVPHGDDIAIVYIAYGVVKNIWYYNLVTQKTLLTYQQ